MPSPSIRRVPNSPLHGRTRRRNVDLRRDEGVLERSILPRTIGPGTASEGPSRSRTLNGEWGRSDRYLRARVSAPLGSTTRDRDCRGMEGTRSTYGRAPHPPSGSAPGLLCERSATFPAGSSLEPGSRAGAGPHSWERRFQRTARVPRAVGPSLSPGRSTVDLWSPVHARVGRPAASVRAYARCPLPWADSTVGTGRMPAGGNVAR